MIHTQKISAHFVLLHNECVEGRLISSCPIHDKSPQYLSLVSRTFTDGFANLSALNELRFSALGACNPQLLRC